MIGDNAGKDMPFGWRLLMVAWEMGEFQDTSRT